MEARPFIIAGLILIAGIGCFVYFLFRQLGSLDEDFVRVTVPGEHLVELKEAGDYTVFHEFKSVIGNRVYSSPESIPGLECSLVSARTGQSIPILATTSNTHYEFGGNKGVSILEFRIDEPGPYRFSGRYVSAGTAPLTVLTIEHGFLKKLLLIIFPAIGILFVSIGIAIVMTVLAILRHQRSVRQNRLVIPDQPR